ncbi:MAG TPA: helix-turn-helix domain-containing protein [Acidimicrobiales bacterium]
MPDGRAPTSPTRERILDAALDLFVEQGVRGTTISDIERQVGLAAGTGSFYRHFPSKEVLLRAAVEREAAQCMAEVHRDRAAMALPDDPQEAFAARAAQTLRDMRRFDRLLRLLLAERDRVPELRDTIVSALGASEALGPWMDDPVVLVTVAALAGYHQFGLVDGGPFSGVDEAEFIATLASLIAPTESRPAL